MAWCFPRVAYPYAFYVHRARGHAAISTGAPPAVTGIVANGWYPAAPRAGERPAEYDPGRADPAP
jgi:hypothetical protein